MSLSEHARPSHWEGPRHVLVVEPDGEWRVEHPSVCSRREGRHRCSVAAYTDDFGLDLLDPTEHGDLVRREDGSVRVTRPGSYYIASWGCRIEGTPHSPTEYDGGLVLIGPTGE